MKLGEGPEGSIFNPKTVQRDYIVHFEYEPGSYFEVELRDTGCLSVRTSGRRSDLISTHHQVANSCFVVPRRWSESLQRYAELINGEGE